jgi:hypothetical protein
MRGYDQVSFVFGLEVTWSLIQQRQQEEEEREAMLELEKMDEIEAAFDNDENEKEHGNQGNDDEDKGNESEESEEEEEENEQECSVSNIVSTDTENSDQVIGTEEPAETPETGENNSLVDSDRFGSADDGEDAEEETGDADLMEEEEAEANIVAEMETETPEESSAAAAAAAAHVQDNQPPEPAADITQSNTWECSQCTYANKMRRKTCEMCNFKGNSKRQKK